MDTNRQFLQRVGDKVRSYRARRGMTRKILAHDSLVSERYLADLEQGKGNISISLLRQVANSLGADVSELVSTKPEQSPELSLIMQFLSELTNDEQQKALGMLYHQFSRQGNIHRRIALIGLRGAGKTSLGTLLEKNFDLPFIRLADQIEKLAGMSISEVFSLSGQSGYQRLEEKALMSSLNEYQSCCLETGGSIVSEPKTLNLLLTNCFVIWVKATPEEHMQRVIDQGDLRRMADNKEAMHDLQQILIERSPFYEKADAVLDTSGKSIDESFHELTHLLRESTSILQSNRSVEP